MWKYIKLSPSCMQILYQKKLITYSRRGTNTITKGYYLLSGRSYQVHECVVAKGGFRLDFMVFDS